MGHFWKKKDFKQLKKFFGLSFLKAFLIRNSSPSSQLAEPTLYILLIFYIKYL